MIVLSLVVISVNSLMLSLLLSLGRLLTSTLNYNMTTESAKRPRRTVTNHRSSFVRTGLEAVEYDLSIPDIVTITIPPSSEWTSGPHWHEKHTEYLYVTQGKALVTLAGSTWVHSSSDGVIEVKPGQIHEWRRAPKQNDESEEDLVVKEYTDPADGQKEVFFRMLNSFLTEPEPQRLHAPVVIPESRLEKYTVPLQLFIIFQACDNWPVVLSTQGMLGWALSHFCLRIACILGGLILGLRPVYAEYVSSELRYRTLMGMTDQKDHSG